MTIQEDLNANEQAYDMGYNDYIEGNSKIDYSDWSLEGSHSAYCAGYQDAENDVPESYLD